MLLTMEGMPIKNTPGPYGMTDCWEWQGPTMKGGRGFRYGYPTINGKHVLAHRLAWERAHGRPVPEGKIIRHKCDNTLCVNPEHLVPGTQRDNVMDMVKRGRHGNSIKSAQSCRNGHPRTPENTRIYYRRDRPGAWERVCRPCATEKERKRRLLRRSAT